jgi:hypothetical protein
VKFACGKCGRSYVADETVRSRAFKMKCRQCGNVIVVRPADGAPTPPPLPVQAVPLPPPAGVSTPALGLEAPPALSEPDPFAPGSSDPFAHPADPFAVVAPAANGAPQAAPHLTEVDAMFADLAQEMADSDAQVLASAAAVTGSVEAGLPRSDSPPVDVETAPAPPPPARAFSRAAIGVAAAIALVAAGSGWFLLRSDAPAARREERTASPSAMAAPREAPAHEAHATAIALAPAAAPPGGAADEVTVPPAPPDDVRAEATARSKPGPPRERMRVAANPALNLAPKAAPRPALRTPAAPALPAPAPAAPAPAAPAPAAPAANVAEVEVRPRSSSAAQVPAGRDAPAPPPLTSSCDLPPLDDEVIASTIAKHASAFDACVAAARGNEPGLALAGRRIVVTVTVSPSGKAQYPTLDDVELGNSELGRCIKRETGKIAFPAFSGNSIRAQVPITIR